MARFTAVEQGIDQLAHRVLASVPSTGSKAWLAEFLVFGAKQAWACVFGATLLAVLIGARLWYPEDAALARNDFLTIAAVIIQIIMVALIIAFPRLVSIEKKIDMKEQLELKIDVPVQEEAPPPSYDPGR